MKLIAFAKDDACDAELHQLLHALTDLASGKANAVVSQIINGMMFVSDDDPRLKETDEVIVIRKKVA